MLGTVWSPLFGSSVFSPSPNGLFITQLFRTVSPFHATFHTAPLTIITVNSSSSTSWFSMVLLQYTCHFSTLRFFCLHPSSPTPLRRRSFTVRSLHLPLQLKIQTSSSPSFSALDFTSKLLSLSLSLIAEFSGRRVFHFQNIKRHITESWKQQWTSLTELVVFALT